MMFRAIGDMLSPAGRKGMLVILVYHRVLAQPDALLDDEMDAACFDGQMRMLASEFNVLPLGEACARLARGTLPSRAVSVTFDDGYADNEQVAAPVLARLGLRATFFVATGFLGSGAMFNDVVIEAVRSALAGRHDLGRFGLGVVDFDSVRSRRTVMDRLIDVLKYRSRAERDALARDVAATLRMRPPQNLMMTDAQIRHLHQCGMEIGAHTINHPILSLLGAPEARFEIEDSKRVLERIIGSPVTLFAYPNGKPDQDYGADHVRMVREAGYAGAVTTVRAVCHGGSDAYQLPRIAPWDRDPRRLAARLLAMCAAQRSGHLAPASVGERIES